MKAWSYIKNARGQYWAGGAQKLARWTSDRGDASQFTSRATAQANIDGGVFEADLVPELTIEDFEVGS